MVPAAASLAGAYAALSLPVAIVAGLGDEVVDMEHNAHRLAQELPGSTLHEIPDSGHMVHHTEPERVGAVIKAIAQPPNSSAAVPS